MYGADCTLIGRGHNQVVIGEWMEERNLEK